jgi:hypothetical protein
VPFGYDGPDTDEALVGRYDHHHPETRQGAPARQVSGTLTCICPAHDAGLTRLVSRALLSYCIHARKGT